jgi:hypothetical protein
MVGYFHTETNGVAEMTTKYEAELLNAQRIADALAKLFS